jgi:4-aminobutyrate aminotransferase
MEYAMTESGEHFAPCWACYSGIIAERGDGSLIYADDGEIYLDFTSGIGVTNVGHCHPRVVEAVRQQAGKLLHGQANIVRHRPLLELVEELRTIVPPELDGFLFKNSGAEAIEAAIKLARLATKRTNVIVFQGSFHGRTVGAMSLTTSKTIYRAGYQPLMPGVFVAPFPYAYRYGWEPDATVDWCLNELDYLLHSQTAPEETACMLIEPVLGEGGYVVPPPGFLSGLRKICDQHGILLIIDEVQSGFGRTGRWFGFQHFDVMPDIMVIAKGLASGLPLAGVVARMDLMDPWAPGAEGGTYGGNALACAAAVASVRAMRDEGLIDNARERGEQLMAALRTLQAQYAGIGDVRGLGLMVGVEFTDPHGRPDKKHGKAVQAACLEENLLILTCGTWDNTLRFIPPLVVTAEQIEDGLARFGRAVARVLG